MKLNCPKCNFEYELPNHIVLNDKEIIVNYPKLWTNYKIVREHRLLCMSCDADLILFVMKKGEKN